jgi:hypothetical protein
VIEEIPQPAPSRTPHTILVRNEHPRSGAQLARSPNGEMPLVRLIADRIKAASNG